MTRINSTEKNRFYQEKAELGVRAEGAVGCCWLLLPLGRVPPARPRGGTQEAKRVNGVGQTLFNEASAPTREHSDQRPQVLPANICSFICPFLPASLTKHLAPCLLPSRKSTRGSHPYPNTIGC